jgi:hypothetical protein
MWISKLLAVDEQPRRRNILVFMAEAGMRD